MVCGWETPDQLLRAGRNLLEQDHIDGDVNNADLVVPLCPNCHAVHSEAQRRLGVELRHATDGSVLERRAAGLRSRAGLWAQLADADRREAHRLERIAAALDDAYPGWRQLPEARP